MTDEVDKVFDPFLGKEVEISARLTDRLRGRYAIGPMLPNGEPEFGWRVFELKVPIQLEAAAEIEKLRAERDALRPTLRWSRAQGHTFDEMREIVRNSELYQHGDTILVWVNEGDLLGLTDSNLQGNFAGSPLAPEKP